MKQLVAFDLDGTLAESKQPLQEPMGEALADLLGVAHVAVISGGDWPQFDKQVALRLPADAKRERLWLMPTKMLPVASQSLTISRRLAELSLALFMP